MEFKAAMRIWKRMCKSIPDSDCDGCPFDEVRNETCRGWANKHPDEAEAILAKWAAEHPERTIADDFFEKHPNAPGFGDKKPLVCAVHCGYIDKCPDDFSALECNKCWQRPLEEVK